MGGGCSSLMNLDGSDRAQSSPLGIQGYSLPKNLWLGDPVCIVILSLTKTNTSSNKELIIKHLQLTSPFSLGKIHFGSASKHEQGCQPFAYPRLGILHLFPTHRELQDLVPCRTRVETPVLPGTSVFPTWRGFTCTACDTHLHPHKEGSTCR